MKPVICLILSLVLALTALVAPSEVRASAPAVEMAQMDHVDAAKTSAECIGCDPTQADQIANCNDGCATNCMAGGTGACTLGEGLSFPTAAPDTQIQAGEGPKLSGMAAPPEPFPPKASL
ncbi:hypothetical protein [Neptunicoccus cionae]|nr:hypothetical protein [Amylibacter cionae]